MKITVELPEDIALQLERSGRDLSRAALEALAVEGYRSGALSEAQVRKLLNLGTRHEVHGFLKEHDVPLRYTELDLESDTENARKFSQQWLSSQTPRR
jgi:predicted HTH domain antitoxin